MSFNVKRGIRNASYLTIGNILTQFLSFFAVIYIARKLGVNDYGIYVTVGTFVSLFHVFLILGINKVIIREGSKNIDKLSSLLNSTFGLRAVFIIISIIICIISSFFTSYDTLTKVLIIIHSNELAYYGFTEVYYIQYIRLMKRCIIFLF